MTAFRAATVAATMALSCASQAPALADSFTGPYIGIAGHYGVALADYKVDRLSTGFVANGSSRNEGPALAGFVGYDWQTRGHGVVGLTADMAVSKFGSTNSYVSTFRGRAGILADHRTLVYVTGGLALLKSDISGRLGGYEYSVTDWVPGWALGAGVEQRRVWGTHPVRVGLEVTYLDFNSRVFEVPDRKATLDYSGWSGGVRVAFELNRPTAVASQPMK